MARGGSTIGTVMVTTLVTSAVWIGFAAAYYDKLFPCPPCAKVSYAEAGAAGQPPAASPRVRRTSAAIVSVPGGIVVPVVGVKSSALVDTFNDARADGRVHDAIDIPAPLGTPVVAAAPGRVEKLYQSVAGGTTAYVRSPDGRFVYYYAHLAAYAPGLAEGAELAAGAPIGTVGFTGNASPDAPHLHFAILATSPERKWHDAADAINPYTVLRGGKTSAGQ